HSRTSIKSDLKYYVEEAEQTEEVKAKLKEINKEYANRNISEITFIDPCCGSGHILVYAFDLFYKMYLESGYVSSDIPSKILQNNLIGIDIDKRAVQLTSFALTMKALSYDKDFLSKDIHPTVIYVKESNSFNDVRLKEFIKLAKLNNQDEDIVYEIVEKFKDAELYGSLIKDFNHTPEQYDILLKQLTNTVKADYFYNIVDQLCVKEVLPLLSDLLKQAIIMSSKYDIMATNPPYLSTSTNDKLKEFAYSFYPDSKTDMFAMFMEVPFVKDNGFLAMINMNSWLFLSSYEKLRIKQLNKNYLSMCHLGARAFEEIGGEVVQTTSFIVRECNISKYKTQFYRLVSGKTQQSKEQLFLYDNSINYITDIESFKCIPTKPFSYWVSDNVKKIFNIEKIDNYFFSDGRNVTGDNNRFVRKHWEVDNNIIGRNKKWIHYVKGGGYRKWYGNVLEIVDWSDNARKFYKENSSSRIIAEYLWYRTGITWNLISSGVGSFRLMEGDNTFDMGGPSILPKNKNVNYLYTLSYLNSKVAGLLNSVVNQTINYQVEHAMATPIIFSDIKEDVITRITKENIIISKTDWDQYETSYDFKTMPLSMSKEERNEQLDTGMNGEAIKLSVKSLQNRFERYKDEVNRRFEQLKKNEEEINNIFIDIFNLHDELSSNVDCNYISITKLYNNKNEVELEMQNNSFIKTKEDVVKDLISYIVGCAFGRYSPYKAGLQFAGGKFEYAKYIDDLRQNNNIIKDIKNVVTSVLPTEENCLLISDKEYFDNDLCNYVVDFVRKIFGDECYEENLNFIATALDDSHKYTSKETIRNYLFSDFFKDHCKKYQNRPIYWLLDSGKNGGFRALMYLHRYDESTIPTARLSYLHELQWKYDQDKERLERFIKNTSISSEKVKAQRELDLLNKQIVESRNYDEILNHASNMRITLDLDDGVKVNYQKLQCLDGDKDKNILSTYLKFKEKE
ncbi:MAG: BREX-1 system adenine-specific DNA-methyltransferase PglX, partial [Bacilli bacterium]